VESTARYQRIGEHYLGNQRPTWAQRKEPMSKVFVLDTNKQALNPMHPGRARLFGQCPITSLSQELVRFDTQVMENPDIEGVEYQQGELAGYEIREYVLVKWNHTCAYCDAQNVPFQLDHVQARSRNGSNRVSNLVLACESCNRLKGNLDIRTFLKEDPIRLGRILAHLKARLVDAAAVNATRWSLNEQLKTFGLPLECGSGGRTKYNRIKRGLAKTHWLDAACVGASTPQYHHVERNRAENPRSLLCACRA
jgi:5-methylcytosine-specific restriction endonuclease McrA